MVLVKLSAEDERTILRAKTLSELEGLRALLIDRIERAKVLKSFGKAETVKSQAFRWQDAFQVCQDVLGVGNVTKPPYPEYQWYQMNNTCIKRWGMDADYIRKVAEYAKDHLRMPVQFQFLLKAHERILAGAFDTFQPKAKDVPGPGRDYKGKVDPMAAQLPEE